MFYGLDYYLDRLVIGKLMVSLLQASTFLYVSLTFCLCLLSHVPKRSEKFCFVCFLANQIILLIQWVKRTVKYSVQNIVPSIVSMQCQRKKFIVCNEVGWKIRIMSTIPEAC